MPRPQEACDQLRRGCLRLQIDATRRRLSRLPPILYAISCAISTGGLRWCNESKGVQNSSKIADRGHIFSVVLHREWMSSPRGILSCPSIMWRDFINEQIVKCDSTSAPEEASTASTVLYKAFWYSGETGSFNECHQNNTLSSASVDCYATVVSESRRLDGLYHCYQQQTGSEFARSKSRTPLLLCIHVHQPPSPSRPLPLQIQLEPHRE
jgi:hypothetical protein